VKRAARRATRGSRSRDAHERHGPPRASTLTPRRAAPQSPHTSRSSSRQTAGTVRPALFRATETHAARLRPSRIVPGEVRLGESEPERMLAGAKGGAAPQSGVGAAPPEQHLPAACLRSTARARAFGSRVSIALRALRSPLMKHEHVRERERAAARRRAQGCNVARSRCVGLVASDILQLRWPSLGSKNPEAGLSDMSLPFSVSCCCCVVLARPSTSRAPGRPAPQRPLDVPSAPHPSRRRRGWLSPAPRRVDRRRAASCSCRVPDRAMARAHGRCAVVSAGAVAPHRAAAAQASSRGAREGTPLHASHLHLPAASQHLPLHSHSLSSRPAARPSPRRRVSRHAVALRPRRVARGHAAA
jgi:hypothetical protein